MKRVTVTLPDELVAEIDRWENNRSRFVQIAAERELESRRRRQLELSLSWPHAESQQVSEAGMEAWGSGGDSGDETLVDRSVGRAVRWTPGNGWVEDGE